MSYRPISFIPNFNGHNVFSNRFNQIDKMFSTLTGEKPISDTPQYNLRQINEIKYELIISIPGYEEKELDISVHNNQLLIKGIKKYSEEYTKETEKWLHKGIMFNNFSLNFNLDHKIEVKKAELSLGLLKLNFECKIPEEEKPKKISINISDNSKIVEKQ